MTTEAWINRKAEEPPKRLPEVRILVDFEYTVDAKTGMILRWNPGRWVNTKVIRTEPSGGYGP